MDLNYIRRLAKIFDDSKATQMIIEEEGLKIKFSKNLPQNIIHSPETHHFSSFNPIYAGTSGNISPEFSTSPDTLSTKTQKPVISEATISETKEEKFHTILSPIVGTFYRSAAPGDPPLVEVGSRVVKGQTLCIIEAMKLMNDIESDINGTISKILVQNASPVEFNQPLFYIIPD